MTISDFNDHPKQDGGGGPSEGCEEPTAVTGREMVNGKGWLSKSRKQDEKS